MDPAADRHDGHALDVGVGGKGGAHGHIVAHGRFEQGEAGSVQYQFFHEVRQDVGGLVDESLSHLNLRDGG